MAEDPQYQFIQNLFTEIVKKMDHTNENIMMLTNGFKEFGLSVDRLITSFANKVDRLMKTYEIIFHTKEMETANEKIKKMAERLGQELSEDKVSDLLSQLIEIVVANQSLLTPQRGGGSNE